jgi:hypothetical protein
VGFFLFRRESNAVAQRERVERFERRVAEGFRQLAAMLSKAAELIDAQRLKRSGYQRPDNFLERTDKPRR